MFGDKRLPYFKATLPVSCAIFLICSCCYTNRAVINPYSYAPKSPSQLWTVPSNVKPMALNDEPPDLPTQEEPYSLGELVDIALRNNVFTKLTWAQARAAAAQYGQSQSQLFPQFTGSFSYERVRTPSFSTALTPGNSVAASNAFSAGSLNQVTVQDIYYSDWGPQLAITYLIFDFGTLRATTEASRWSLYNADWNHNSMIQNILQTIMTDFYNYLYQKQLYVADEANIATAELTLDAAEVGLSAGVRDISDYLQAKTQLLQNQTTWAAQQQNVENALAQLLTDMGLPANIQIETQDLPTTLPDNDFLPPLEELIAIAFQNRPDLMASEANLKSTEKSLLAAKRQFLPKLNYTFDIGKTYFNGGLHDKYNFDSLFTVSMPLFSGFYYRNAIKNAEANKKQAEEQLRNTQLNVIQQVTTYHFNVKVSFETLQFATAFLAAAQEQYEVALSQYKQGVNTILNVVSAQSSLVDARAQQAGAIQQWYSSLANIAYATGLISPTYLPTSTAQEVIKIKQVEETR
jgi:outer membrane protein